MRRRLHRLGRLVDHREREPATREHRGVDPGQRRHHHLRPVEHVPLGPVLEPPGLREQFPGAPLGVASLAEAPRPPLLPPLARLAPERERLLDEPRGDARRLVPLDARLERPIEQPGHDPRRVPDAHAVEARRDQPLEQVVGGQVRGRGGEHLLPAGHRAPDHLDEHGGLPRPGRTVHEREVERAVGEVERRLLLRSKGPGEGRPAGPGEEPGRLAREQRMPALPVRRRDPSQPGREPLPGDGRGNELERHPPRGGPVRRRLVEDHGDPVAAPARHHARGRVVPLLAAQLHPHERTHPDARRAERTPRAPVGDERSARQAGLVERLHVGERDPPRLPLGERQPGGRVGEPGLLLVPLGGEEGGEPRQVVVEGYQAMAIPPGRGEQVAGLRRLPSCPAGGRGTGRPSRRGCRRRRRPGRRRGSACWPPSGGSR